MDGDTKLIRKYFYLLSFLEGACVMACELIGARLLSPYFGASLYIWAAVLGITLGGLMLGYFFGGLLSRDVQDNRKALYLILLSAAVFLFLMPFTSKYIMDVGIDMKLQTGALISLVVFMLPPLVFMGMVSPVIINLLTVDARNAGNSAGNVYAVSTLGGILATFLMGFYIIPEFGITRPAMAGGFVLGILPAVSLVRRKSYTGVIVLVLLAILGATGSPSFRYDDKYTVLYYSEGILGQLKVIEFTEPEQNRRCRGLVVNNTLQTVVDIRDPDYDHWPYTRLIQFFAAQYAPGSRAMLLGMGGGTLVQRLNDLAIETYAVEIDRRIKEVAIGYFGLTPEIRVVVDDARHAIRTSPEMYNLIIFDVFKGEEAPSHIITKESLDEVEAILGAGGMVVINFYGYLEGSLGLLTRSIAKTLTVSGFDVELYVTPGLPDERNVVMTASPAGARNEPKISDRQAFYAERLGYRPVPVPLTGMDEAFILTDEKPQIYLYAEAAMQWRRLYNDYFLR